MPGSVLRNISNMLGNVIKRLDHLERKMDADKSSSGGSS